MQSCGGYDGRRRRTSFLRSGTSFGSTEVVDTPSSRWKSANLPSYLDVVFPSNTSFETGGVTPPPMSHTMHAMSAAREAPTAGTLAGGAEPGGDDVVPGEARWPMAGAVLAAMVLTILLPDSVRAGPAWLLPLIEGLLLVAVIAGDPGRIDRRSQELRALSVVLVAVLVFEALWELLV